MYIKEINIYGFGKIENAIIHPKQDLQVFFGENEAGKSTIMAFIQNILFGFPTKVQNERRFEPKTHSKFGGQLILDTEEWGEITVERVKGKATGDVKVVMMDGTSGGEELLVRLLAGMDKATFQGIFSFSVHGLQQVNRLKKEDLGKFLFAAGTVGTERVFQAGSELQKELDSRFKPSGRKPQLNQDLDELRQLEKAVKKARHDNEKYGTLLEEIEKNENELQDFNKKKEHYQQELIRFQHLQRMTPLYHQYIVGEKRLLGLDYVQFPTEGMKRLEMLADKLRMAASQREAALAQNELLEKELKKNEPHAWMEENESEYNQFINEWPLFTKWKEEEINLANSLSDMEEKIERNRRELQLPKLTYDEWDGVQAGLQLKERMKEAVDEHVRLQVQRSELEEQQVKETNRLSELDNLLATLEKDMLSEEEFRSLEKSTARGKTSEALRDDLRNVIERMEDLKGQAVVNKKQWQSTLIFQVLFATAASGLLIWGITQSHLLAGVLAVMAMGATIIHYLYSRKKSNDYHTGLKRKMADLREKENQLKMHIQDTESKSPTHGQSNYENQVKLRNDWKQTLIRLEEQQERCEEAENQLNKWKNQWREHINRVSRLKEELKLDAAFPVSRLEDAYHLFKENSDLAREYIKRSEIHSSIKDKINGWDGKLKRMTSEVFPQHFILDERIREIKGMLKQEDEKRIYYREAKQKLFSLKESLIKSEKELEHLQSQWQELLNGAGARNEEEFRETAQLFKEKEELKERLALLRIQLTDEDLRDLKKYADEELLAKNMAEVEGNIKHCAGWIADLQKRNSELAQEVKVMEEGGVYTDLMHRWNHLKSQFNERAMEWAAFSAAKSLLMNTIQRFEAERFPKVIAEAEKYLSILTDGEYAGVIQQKDQAFLIRRKDGVLFDPSEVSQATSEQIYTAFRFALVTVLKTDYPFPLIIDDAFVHFDERRTKAAAAILKELSKHTQILFFTCHSHLQTLFEEQDVIELHSETVIIT